MKKNINLRKKYSSGFTIVETMIVLAIAGLILLIVLLAVPALQRQSNNSNIKSDANAIASAISDFESNNGGYVPGIANFGPTAGSDANANGTVTIGSVSSTSNSDIASTAKVQSADKVVVSNSTPSLSPAPAGNPILVVTGITCSEQPDTRSIAIYYPVQTSSGESYSTTNCIE